jgi:transketolase
MALAEAHLAARYNKPDHTLINHHTYVVAGDGCLQEGISSEASSLAGHWGLGKLIVLYDDNNITIDGPTHLSFTEDVLARYTAYGWHVQRVDGQDGSAVAEAIRTAQQTADQPSIIACRTTIGYGSPNKANSAGIHGSPMGEAEIRLTKEALGWPVDEKFLVPDEVREFMDARPAGQMAQAEWQLLWANYTAAYPAEAAELHSLFAGELPADWQSHLPQFEMGTKVATRNASGKVLAAIVPHMPTLLGGSADLTGSNKTDVKGIAAIHKGDFSGRYLYYGVREHAMGAIMNGLALHGGFIPYGGTFMVFTDYCRPAIRLSALMALSAGSTPASDLSPILAGHS